MLEDQSSWMNKELISVSKQVSVKLSLHASQTTVCSSEGVGCPLFFESLFKHVLLSFGSCWLRVDNYFIWSFIGPVSFVIGVSH